MNARARLAELLDKWLQLTHREFQAIEGGVWKELAGVQALKNALQDPLRDALDDWKNENRTAGAATEDEAIFRSTVDRLLTLETRSAELLAARRQKALERKSLIEQAGRNLRMVRDSYARNPDTEWQVYS